MGKCVRLSAFVVFLWAAFFPTAHADISSGARWLGSTAQANGSYAQTYDISIPFQSTAEALRTFNALNITASGTSAALQFLSAEPYQNTEKLSRLIIAGVQNGQNVSALVSQLLANQDSSGGFSELPGYQPTVLDTTFALEALALSGSLHSQAAGYAVSFLQQRQASDGSWSETDGDNLSSVYLTALAMRSIWYYRQAYSVSSTLQSASSWLLSQVDANGNWAAPFLSAQALIAIAPTLLDRSPIQSNLQALQAQQLSDGSFGEDTYTTALALRALQYASQPAPDAISIQGRVIDGQTGNALGGATVTLSGPQNYTAATSADGGFSFIGIPAGTYTIQIANTGFGTVASTTLAASTGHHLDLGTIALTPNSSASSTSGIVEGTVSDSATGQQIAGAVVEVGSLSATTAANGSYEIANVPAGAAGAVVTAAGYQKLHVAVNISAGNTLLFSPQLVVGTTAGTGTTSVQGQITDASTGNPIQGAVVSISGSVTASAQTDANGSYTITQIPAGSIQISVGASGYDSVAAGAEAGSNTSITFSPKLYAAGTSPANANTATVIGTVVDSTTGQPLAGAVISAMGGQFQTDASGQFKVPGITSSSVALTFQLQHYLSASFSAPVHPDATNDLGQIRLLPESAVSLLPDLSITLVDSKSAAVSDAQSFALSGIVSATLKNIGTAPAGGGFNVLAFYDTNANGIYDAGTDVVLGQVMVSQQVQVGDTVPVQIPVSGSLPFRDAPVSVVADSGNIVVESNENNNVGVSSSLCQVAPGPTKYYGYNPYPQPGVNVLFLNGYQAGTQYTLRPLSGSAPSISGTIGRFQTAILRLDNMQQFVLETSAKVTTIMFPSYQSYFSYTGTFFYPGIDGENFYSTDFLAYPDGSFGSYDILILFALDDSVVRIYDTSGNLVQTTPVIAAGTYFRPAGLQNGHLYEFKSTGRIALENLSGNAVSEVPPVPSDASYSNQHSDVGKTYFFATEDWCCGYGSGVASVANVGDVTATFNLTNIRTGAPVLTNQSVAPGQIFGQVHLENDFYRIDVLSGRVMVEGGDCENAYNPACTLNDFGDDVVYARGDNGYRSVVNVAPNPYFNMTHNSAYVFSGNDNTNVTVNGGTSQTLNADGFIQLPGGTTAVVKSDKPVMIQITGGGTTDLNDWGKPMVPAQILLGRPDLTAGMLQVIDNGVGNPLTLGARIGNGGQTASPASTAAFYSGDPGNGGTLIGTVPVAALNPSSYQDVSLAGVTGLGGSQDVYVVVDPQNLIQECDKTNNVDHVPFSATVPAGGITISTDATSYGPNAAAGFTGVATNQGSLPADLKIDLRVEDGAGNLVADLGTTDLGMMAGGASANDNTTWNTATALAGSYVLHGLLLRASDGGLAAEARAPFGIVARTASGSSTEVTLRVTTDKPIYNTTDLVSIGDLVQDISVNGLVPNATLQLTVLNPGGMQVLSVNVPLGQLTAGYLRQLSNLYNLSASPQGRYNINGTVVDGSGAVLAAASASFQVTENEVATIVGIEVSKYNPVNQDDPQTCTETVTDRGTQNVPGLALQLLVVNLDTGTLDSQSTATVNLTAGATLAMAPRTFSTSPLAYGNHACVLQALINGSYKTLASAAFVVKQPPIRVSGTETVQSPWVYQGDAETCTDVVKNTGSQSLPALPVRQQIVSAGGTVEQQADVTGNVAPGASQTFVRNFTTGGLAIGTHSCVVLAQPQSNGGYQTLASASFEVRQPPVRVSGTLGLGSKGRLLVLMDSPTDHGPPLCNTGLVDVSFEADFGQSLSPDAVVEVKLFNSLGLLVDTETTSLRSFTGEVNLHAGNGVDLIIPSFTADSLVVRLAGVTAGHLLSGTYRIVATVSNQANLQYLVLNSGLVSLTCNVVGAVGSILNNTFTVIGLNNSISNAGTGIGDGPDSKTIPQQEATLQALLSQDGWSYDLVLNKNDFATKLRSGGYQDYALLSEYQVLDPQVQEELREHVYNGEGLLVAGRHDVRTRILDNPLGIQYMGTQLAPTGVQMLAGNAYGLSGQESFTQNNNVQRFLLKGATVDGNVLNSIPNGQNSLVTHNAYGNGIAALGGYDLLAEASAETTPGLHASLIRKPLLYANPSQSTVLAGRVVPLRLDISNTGIANTTQVTVATSLNGYVVAASAGTVANGKLSWTTPLAVGQTLGLNVWVQVSADGSPVTVTATLVASAGGFTASPVVITQTINPTVKPSLVKAIADLTAYVAAQPPPGLLGAVLDPILGLKTPAAAALDQLKAAQQDLNGGLATKALGEMATATGYLINDGSSSIKPIRVEVDEAIRQTEVLL